MRRRESVSGEEPGGDELEGIDVADEDDATPFTTTLAEEDANDGDLGEEGGLGIPSRVKDGRERKG